MSLQDKVAVITGAAAGLGREAALIFAARGARVIAVDIEADGLAATAETAASDAFEPVTADLSVEADVERVMETAISRFGRLDHLVNCAAILPCAGARVDSFPTEAFLRAIEVNLTGTFYCVKHATPPMEKAGGGVMILLASGAGIHGGSASVPYAASKGGVHGMALCVQDQVTPLGIRIHVALPENMNTRIRVGAIGEMAERRGKSREEAEEKEYDSLPSPERSARFLAGLASDEGEEVADQLLISVGQWWENRTYE